jgi:hypothetical protein
MDSLTLEDLTLEYKLRCCELKICHSECSIKLDNPFCHDTKCRECDISWLKFEDSEKNACQCCGYHICDKCQINKNIIFDMKNECPKCKM